MNINIPPSGGQVTIVPMKGISIKDNFKIPVFAYQVSGEYSLIKNGIINKTLSEDAIYESLMSFKRAGCNAIVTYFADYIASKLR